MSNSSWGFIIRPKYKFLLEALTREQLGNLIAEVIKYLEHKDFDKMELGVVEKVAFCAIKDQIIADNEKYQKRVEVNRKNGQKGGRPPKKQAPEQHDPNGDKNPF